MSEPYNALQITQDAVEFMESRYGQHHVKRLTTQRERYLTLAMNPNYTDTYRAHAATKASVYQEEIDYLTTQKAIQNNPKLLQRMRDKLKSRKEEEPPEL